jgi:ADP-ribose pyrophosphatase
MPEEKWNIRKQEQILTHPYVQVLYQEVELPNGRTIPDWPIVKAKDYVNAFVLNSHGKIMILEGYKHGLGQSSWQVLGGYLEAGEDPLAAVKRELLEETGYHSDEWLPLGTHVVDANRFVGQGHFFLAHNARQISEPDYHDLEEITLRWETPQEVRQALFDGRVAILSYAVNIALGLLAIETLSP